MTSVSNISILIVDDEPPHRLLTRRILEKHGIEVLEADTIKVGKSVLESTPLPSCVLIDINLGKESGLDLLASIRAQSTLSTLPVLMLSTSDLERQASANIGAQGYVLKALDQQVYRETLELKLREIGILDREP